MRTIVPGEFSKEADGYKVVLERTFNHPIDKVWDAITNPDKLKIWFTDFEMDFRPGGEMKIWFRDEAKTETHGKIVRIEPPHRFEWMWEAELAVFELSEVGPTACKLVLTYSRIDESYAASVPAGFHLLLDQLETVLDGRTEPYPFDGNETTESIAMQKRYQDVILPKYPELRHFLPVIIECTFNTSIDRVWDAITDKEKIKQWCFDIPDFKPEVGHEFEFAGGPDGSWIHLSIVTDVTPKTLLAYTWRYKGYDGDSHVKFELFPEGEKQTRLKLTHSGLHTFPQEVKELHRENFVQGWEEIVGVELRRFLEGN